jgi:excisionase family DNA binding protein
MANSENAVMTVPEVALALRLSRGSVYEYCQRGLIPHIRLGGRIIISRPRFEAWLAGGRPETEATVAR